MKLIGTVLGVLLVLSALSARADNYAGYKSTIEGVGLWALQTYANESGGRQTSERLRFGENPEYAVYCDGKNKLFIYEIPSKGFICRTVYVNEYRNEGGENEPPWKSVDPFDQANVLRLIARAKADKGSSEARSEYAISLDELQIENERILTVSKMRLERGIWIESAPSKSELRRSREIALANVRKIHREQGALYKVVVGFGNEQIRRIAERTEARMYSLKIKTKEFDFFLIPTLFESDDAGGDLISTIVLRDKKRFSFVGHVRGCLLSVGADIDADGLPEVMLENCFNAFSQRVDYIKIFPVIKTLMTYSHS